MRTFARKPTTRPPTRSDHGFRRMPEARQSTARARRTPTLSSPGDMFEQEADRVADEVMRMPEPQLQRACACGGGCPRCRSDSQSPGRTLSPTEPDRTSGTADSAGLPVVDEVLGRTGHPLEASTRTFMESRFGVDFSRVRLHTDSLAAESAKAIGARAFTVRNSIVFGPAQSTPGSKASQRLLAHELTHVVQQNRSGVASTSTPPSIQRQVDGSEESTSPPSTRTGGASLSREYIEVACGVIAEIQTAVEAGQTWHFEDEFLLQGEEWLSVQQPTLVDERRDALRELVSGLDQIIQELESGELMPTDPVGREAIADLWAARNPTSTQALAQRWAPVFQHSRVPSGELRDDFPSLDSYIISHPGSPPGMLRSAAFPTWWVLGCHALDQPEPPSQAGGQGTARELGLSDDRVVYLTGLDRDAWDWEPRGGPYPAALGPVYDWQTDDAGHVFIMVDGQRRYLLRNGRLQDRR